MQAGSQLTAKESLEFLLPPPKLWGYRCVPLYWVNSTALGHIARPEEWELRAETPTSLVITGLSQWGCIITGMHQVLKEHVRYYCLLMLNSKVLSLILLLYCAHLHTVLNETKPVTLKKYLCVYVCMWVCTLALVHTHTHTHTHTHRHTHRERHSGVHRCQKRPSDRFLGAQIITEVFSTHFFVPGITTLRLVYK